MRRQPGCALRLTCSRMHFPVSVLLAARDCSVGCAVLSKLVAAASTRRFPTVPTRRACRSKGKPCAGGGLSAAAALSGRAAGLQHGPSAAASRRCAATSGTTRSAGSCGTAAAALAAPAWTPPRQRQARSARPVGLQLAPAAAVPGPACVMCCTAVALQCEQPVSCLLHSGRPEGCSGPQAWPRRATACAGRTARATWRAHAARRKTRTSAACLRPTPTGGGMTRGTWPSRMCRRALGPALAESAPCALRRRKCCCAAQQACRRPPGVPACTSA